MHEVDLHKRVYERMTANHSTLDEFGIDEKVDVRRFIEEVVTQTIRILNVPITPDGQINTPQHPASVKGFMDAMRAKAQEGHDVGFGQTDTETQAILDGMAEREEKATGKPRVKRKK